ncbi:MAG: helix-turn-helix transcriptional regulator [Gaiellales bacterium]
MFAATLSLLAEAAEEQPVVCLVDDAHWLDAASAEALMFVARRLHADRIALIFGARDDAVRRFDGLGLPELVVSGLDPDAASALLTRQAGVPVADAVRDELMIRTGGNPLALVELPEVLSGGQLTGQVRLPAQLPLTQGVERAFLDRCRRLPSDAQTLLLIAASDGSGRLSVIRQAAARLGAGDAALDAAERSGLIRVLGGDLLLRHPLVRSAVYWAATTSQRQNAHRALAEVLTSAGDIDRRAWQASLAAIGPDPVVAGELDAVAERAAQRGGHEAASAASERAAELTGSSGPRAHRLFAAATSAWLAGDSSRARALADDARRDATEPVLRADIDRLRGRIEWNVGSLQTGQRIIMQAAREVAAADSVRALELAVLGTTLATFSAAPASTEDLDFHLPPPADSAPARLRCFATLLEGHQQLLRGQMRAGAAALRRAVLMAESVPPDAELLRNLGTGGVHLGDHEIIRRSYEQLLTLARDAGDLTTVALALARLPFAEVLAGRWSEATAAADEALVLARAIGQMPLTALPLGWQALLAALRGEAAAGPALAELENVRAGHPMGLLTVAIGDLAEWTKGVLAATAHDTDRALSHLARIAHPALARMAAVDRLDAAVLADRPDLAGTWIDELTAFADTAGAPWATAAAEHGRALLSDGETAQHHYQHALRVHAGARRPVDLARTRLAYGAFLRRNRRRVESRTHLRAALDVFEDLRADPWAERARHELRASGETARKRDVSTTGDLTPQERQTALLVTSGLSNRDIAARLFLSPRTVEYHLSNAYQKLGVSSRGELAQLTLN